DPAAQQQAQTVTGTAGEDDLIGVDGHSPGQSEVVGDRPPRIRLAQWIDGTGVEVERFPPGAAEGRFPQRIVASETGSQSDVVAQAPPRRGGAARTRGRGAGAG